LATILKGRISLQLKISASYLAILLIVMVLMNTYPLVVSEDLVFQSKCASLLSAAASLNTAVSGLDELTEENVEQALTAVSVAGVSRAIVSDPWGKVLYDTREVGSAVGRYVFYNELVEALLGNSTAYSVYKEGAFHSSAAQPVLYRNQTIGGIYVYEYDTQQASLLENLSSTLLSISIAIAALVVMLSALFSRQLTRRLESLQAAIRGVREGAYNQRAILSGHDEFTQIAGEFNDLVDRLQETESARRQFVSDASHELKTPLAAIRLLTDSILQNENMDNATAREFVSDIGQEAERLSRITEDLLRLTRLDSGIAETAKLVEVAPVLERAARMLRPVAAEKGVELLTVSITGAEAVATEGEVHQIIYNLAENAIKYNRPGGCVRVRAEPGEETAIITVEDNGIGIPPEELSNVFKRFYRVDKARSRAAGGTGLGLSIVNDTVSRRGGAIRAENVPGGGTRFVVTLPSVLRGEEETL
jgi:signal transduction histidine kinase